MRLLGSVDQSLGIPRLGNRTNDILRRLDRNRATRNIDPILAQKFTGELDRVNEGQTSETWLRVAVWWLIKVVLLPYILISGFR